MEGLRDARARHAQHIVGLAELLAAHGAQWREQALQADAAALVWRREWCSTTARVGVRRQAAAGWTRGAPAARSSSTSRLRLYARALTISGEPVTVYDPKTPQVWRVPFRDRVSPSLVVKAPLGGYVVAVRLGAGYRRAARGCMASPAKRVRARSEGVRVEAFRATHVRFAAAPFEAVCA